jgi:multidrug efflux system membrane fusion protein
MSVEPNFKKKLKVPFKPLLVIALFLGIAYYLGNIIYHNHQNAAEGHDKKFDQNKKPKTVMVGRITKEDVDISLTALGTITSRNTVLVQSMVGGQLMSVHFKEGDTVKKGQLLAVVDERPYQIQLAQAEGQLAKDKALLDNAKLDLNRYKLEFASHAIPKQTLDTQFALVKQDEAAIKIDQAQIDNVKLQLSYCRITSPIDGMVGMRLIDPGNIIQQNGGSTTGSGIVNVVQMNPITVMFSLPEDQLPSISDKLIHHQELVVEAYDKNNQNRLAKGSLIASNDLIDTATGTIQLKAIFDNQDRTLFPNQFVNVKLLVDTVKDATVAPLSAIQKGRKGDFVYLLDTTQKVHVKPVKVGATSGEKIIVSEGLSPDDIVVVDGADKLKENATVRPIFPKRKQAQGASKSDDADAASDAHPRDHREKMMGDTDAKDKASSQNSNDQAERGEHHWHEHAGHEHQGHDGHWRHQKDQE